MRPRLDLLAPFGTAGRSSARADRAAFTLTGIERHQIERSCTGRPEFILRAGRRAPRLS